MAPTDIKCQTVIEKCAEFSFELVYTQFCLNQQVLKVRVHVLFVLVSQGRFFLRGFPFGDTFVLFWSMMLALSCGHWSSLKEWYTMKIGDEVVMLMDEKGLHYAGQLCPFCQCGPQPERPLKWHHVCEVHSGIMAPPRYAINSSHWHTASLEGSSRTLAKKMNPLTEWYFPCG